MTLSAQVAEGSGVAAERSVIRQTSGHSNNDISKRDAELLVVGGAAISAAEKPTKRLLGPTEAADFHLKVALDKRRKLTSKT